MKTEFTTGDFSGVNDALSIASTYGVFFTEAQRRVVLDAFASAFNSPSFIKKLAQALEEAQA